MSNTIARRVYDFLKPFPPFSFLEEGGLLRLAEKVLIQYYEAHQILFTQDHEASPHIFIVKDGAVELFRKEDQGEQLVDVCDEGDVFGLRPLLVDQPYFLTARSQEETLVYAIPVEELKPLLAQTPAASWFLAQSFAAGVRNIKGGTNNQGRLLLPFYEKERMDSDPLLEVQTMVNLRSLVTASVDDQIKQVAEKMAQEGVGSIILINDYGFPLGIVTHKDLGIKVATGKFQPEEAVSQIMSSPVITAMPNLTVLDAQMTMLEHNVRHLVLTEDGSDQSKGIGVVSQHDMLVAQGNHPVALFRAIKRSSTTQALSEIRSRAEMLLEKYIYQEVSIAFISTVMTKVNDALVRKVIQLSETAMIDEGYGLLPLNTVF